MAKSSVKTGKEIELAPDAWERFERAASVVAESPPQHRAKVGESPERPTVKNKKLRAEKKTRLTD
jgi:hypothetical protein